MTSRVTRTAATTGVTALAALTFFSTATACADGDGGTGAKDTPSATGSLPRKHERDAHWGYQGAGGPANWATLAEDFAACEAGHRQSPIELHDDEVRKPPVPKPVTIDYRPVTAKLVNNGHTDQADVSPGSRIVIDGTSYALKQFHFHLPSEHTVQGVHTAMEMHFVHADRRGHLAVLGGLMEKRPGKSAFADLFAKLPSEEGATTRITKAFDLTAFLPGHRNQYQYEGSLTTPPCTEGVKWIVLRDPVPVAPEEVAAYRELFPKSNRPIQPLYDRELAIVVE